MTSGRIELIIGPMFSGKSTELLRRARVLAISDAKVLYIKFAGDTRYSNDKIITHDGLVFFLSHINSITRCSSETAIPLQRLYDLGDRSNDYDVIAIDEGQFVCIWSPYLLYHVV